MFKVHKDPYNEIGKFIRDHLTVIEDMIAVIEINGVIKNELFMVDLDEDGYFVWEHDWWEGEENVTLLDFFSVSDAQSPSAQPEPQWIPCSERLPEERGFYLVKVCAEYRPIRIYAFSPWDMDKERKFWINDSDSHSHVFNHFVEAWMPLPEPYRAERRTDGTD